MESYIEKKGAFADESKPLYIVSDFHGVYDALDIVKDAVAEKRVVILGDCMDRGPDGMKILAELKSMIEDGQSVVYLPGNHDDTIYIKFKRVIEEYTKLKKQGHKLDSDMALTTKNKINDIVRSSRFDRFSKENGQIVTLNSISEMCSTEEGLKNFLDLMVWLENQPLLRIEKDCDGKKIALGHAAFDMDLYKQETPFTLKYKAKVDELFDKLKNTDTSSKEYAYVKKLKTKALACLWYRLIDESNNLDFSKIVKLPTSSEADQIVVGHTPNEMNIELVGNNIKRTAIVVDGGVVERYLSGKGSMLKYEPHKDIKPSEELVPSFKRNIKELYARLGLEYTSKIKTRKEDKCTPTAEPEEDDDSTTKVYIPPKKKKNIPPSNPGDDGDR